MKLLSTIAFLVLIACSCTNEPNNNTVSTTKDTLPQIATKPTEPAPKASSKYISLNASTFALKVEEHQGEAFVNLVRSKQTALKEATNEFVVRRDTLFEVQYLPFKDQELYLHTIAIEQVKEKDVLNSWCFSVLKNGATIREDQLISNVPFLKLHLEEMKVGDRELVFVGTKKDGTTETFQVPYDGKKI